MKGWHLNHMWRNQKWVKSRVAVGSHFGCSPATATAAEAKFQFPIASAAVRFCCQIAAAATEIVGVTTAHADIQLEIWKNIRKRKLKQENEKT